MYVLPLLLIQICSYNIDCNDNLEWKVLLELSSPSPSQSRAKFGVGQAFSVSHAQWEHFYWKPCFGLYSDSHSQVSDLADVPPHYYILSKFPYRLNNRAERNTWLSITDTLFAEVRKKKQHLKWVLPQSLWKAVQKRLTYQQGPDLMPISVKIREPEGPGD